MTRRWLPAAAALAATTLSLAALAPAAPAPAQTPAASGADLPSAARLAAVRDYISKSWTR